MVEREPKRVFATVKESIMRLRALHGESQEPKEPVPQEPQEPQEPKPALPPVFAPPNSPFTLPDPDDEDFLAFRQ